MNNIAIHVENLAKKYRIGGPQEKYQTFRDVITRAAIAPFRRTQDLLRGQAYGAAGLKEEIWALKDVSFEIEHGEVMGIIGRNGAGKSTLLKILSRITEPTTGYADLYGRVGALLEVGTGFHPELSGRENVYLNGAILGMSRDEIGRKFDEIVDFSGIEKFIDTPVKHYSSGMGLRLGFAVAAHLEPEILVIDEVLAVGDAEFQKKCLGRMGQVASQGRTVLFVSHNMSAIETLCSKVMILETGRVVFLGETRNALEFYLSQEIERNTFIDLRQHLGRWPRMKSIIVGLRIRDANNIESNIIKLGESIKFEIELDPQNEIFTSPSVNIGLYNHFGQIVCALKSDIQSQVLNRVDQSCVVECIFENVRLIPGEYIIGLSFSENKKNLDRLDNVCIVEVLIKDIYGTGKTNRMTTGLIAPEVRWNVILLP